ncbi:MAG: aldehyde dehydrogenase family protein [Cellvibrionales bacterium]|nr:aldehyde dehydrogenase family protein [Cellvibrionales bacterium]
MKKIPVLNPRTGQPDFQIDNYPPAEIAKRATALRTAQQSWQQAGLEYRCAQLAAWRQQLEDHGPAIAQALCADTGRRTFAHFELRKILEIVDHWLNQAPHLLAEKPAARSALVPSVEYRHKLIPYPLVGIISPWNVPLILGLIDTIPALLAGCACLLKPSEITPRFAAPLQASLQGIAGLQDVLGIVTGAADTGQAIIDQADAICFTGSVATGRKVAKHAARRLIPAFLELGGKDPAIVLESADIDNATTAIVRSAIGMTGQACQSLERIYVHQSRYQATLDLLIAKCQQIQINWPDIDSGQIGPLIYAPQAKIIQSQIADAKAKGATIHCGGQPIDHGGIWYPPTVLSNLSPDMRILQEETFGPILPVIPFSTPKQALELANNSEFGLSAAVFSTDRTEAEQLAAQIHAGAVSINDASLTAVVTDVPKNSFGCSGLGGSRMGTVGLTRFLRHRALLYQTAPALSIDIFAEGQIS